jgi:RNA polymerase sigma factor (sigma-70 family)
MTTGRCRMRADLPVEDLVRRAQKGDKQAWDSLIERYAPLVWSICRSSRLGRADAADVGQSVWLQLVDQLETARGPAAMASWLAATTRRECGRARRAAHQPGTAGHVLDAWNITEEHTGIAEHDLVKAERNAALREAFMHLPSRCQQLLGMLIEDPPVPHGEISAKLGIAVESIRAACGRCLGMLRGDPAIAALINTAESGESEIQASQRRCDAQQIAARRRHPPDCLLECAKAPESPNTV